MAEVRARESNPDDRKRSDWMAAAQAGDRNAYEALLRDCVSIIKSVARRQGVPADQVDDVVQEVLLSIHRARATYDPARSFTAWLQVIAERRAIDHLRRANRQRLREVHAPLDYETQVDPSADPSRSVQHADDAARVDRALAGLPERQREAVKHLVLEDRSLADAAAGGPVAGRRRGVDATLAGSAQGQSASRAQGAADHVRARRVEPCRLPAQPMAMSI
jgi:RNA polymerase sigma-70 factor (ECF subfamily)